MAVSLRVTEPDLVSIERSLAMSPSLPADTVRRLIDEVRELHRQRDELRTLLVQLEPHFGAARKQLAAMLSVVSSPAKS